jgi:hypothetical protein
MKISINLICCLCLLNLQGIAQRGAGQQVQKNDSTYSYIKPLKDFDYNKPVFKLQGEQLTNNTRYLRYTALSGYREGAMPTSGVTCYSSFIDPQNGTVRLYCMNHSIEDLVTMGFYNSSRIILEVKDPSKYRYDPKYGPKEAWLRKNAWCFEIALPKGTIKNTQAAIMDNLAAELGLKITSGTRVVKSLILVRTSKTDKIKSSGKGSPDWDPSGHLNNIDLKGPLGSILYNALMPPLVDETGFTGPVDLDMHLPPTFTLEEFRKALQRYDLDLVEGMRPCDNIFVINEINNK